MSIVSRLSNVYREILTHPNTFPKHIQLLHQKASIIREDRNKCGVDQSSITDPLALEKTRKVIYILTRLDYPEHLILSSREPAAIDFIRLSTSPFSCSKEQPRYDNRFDVIKWIKRQGVYNLIIYLLESVDYWERLDYLIGVKFLPVISMFRSLARLKGPGLALATPMAASITDSPFRLSKFKLRPIRHDFHNVLVMADDKCLERAAKEVIAFNVQNQQEGIELGRKPIAERSLSKSSGFWTVFSKRLKASAYILPPKTISLALRAFDKANQDTGIYVALVDPITYIIKSIDGTSLYWTVKVLSRRLKGSCNKELFSMLADQLLNVLYQITAVEALEICQALYSAGYKKSGICRNVGLKMVNSEVTAKDAVRAVSTFGLFRFGDAEIHEGLENILIKNIDQLEAKDIPQAVIGFKRSGHDPYRMLNLLEDKVKDILVELSGNISEEFKIAVGESSCFKRIKEIVSNT